MSDTYDFVRREALSLSAQEQADLVDRIIAGRIAAEGGGEAGSPKEQVRTQRTIQQGKEAELRLSRSLFALVLSIASEEARKRVRSRHREVLEEAVEAGLEGVAKAIATFDTAYNIPISKVAANMIRLQVLGALRTNASVINIPASWERVARIAGAIRGSMTAEHGSAPTHEELTKAVYQYCETTTVEQLLERGADPRTAEEEAVKLLRKRGIIAGIRHLDEATLYTSTLLSGDAPVYEGSPVGLFDLQTDSDDIAEEVVTKVSWAQLRVALMAVMESFTQLERDAVCLRFGFTEDGLPHSYAAIARELGISGEWARQATKEALRKLSEPDRQFVQLAAEIQGIEPGSLPESSPPN